MSNWDKFKDKVETSDKIPFDTVHGTFGCQVCDEYAEEAQYFYTDSVLKWKCPNGHVSFAENFNLG